jgi:hypothetical protein
MKTIYQVACAGWLTVEVEANSPEEAQEIVEETTPGTSGELYDMVVEDVIVASPKTQV